MSKYSAPKNKSKAKASTVFNLNDFKFQDSFVTYTDALNLSAAQTITGDKTFSQNVTIDSVATDGSLTINDNMIKAHANAFEITTDDGYHLHVNSNKTTGGDLIVNSNSKNSNITVENGNLNVKTGNVIIPKGALILNGANIQAIVNNNSYQLSIHADTLSNNSNTLLEHGSNIQSATDVGVQNSTQIVGIQSSYAPLDQPVFTTNLTMPPSILTNNLIVSNLQVGYLSNLNQDLQTSLDTINNELATVVSNQINDEGNINQLGIGLSSLEDIVMFVQSNQTIDEGNINSIQSSVTSISSKQLTDESNILSLQSNVSSISSKQLTDESNITSLESSVSSITSKQLTDESNISSLQSSVTSISLKQLTDESNILSLQSIVSSISSKQLTDESNITSLESSVSSISSKQQTDESNISSIQSSVTSISLKQLTDESNILSLQSNVSSISSKQLTDESNITSLESSVSSISSKQLTDASTIDTINSTLLTLAPIASPIFTGTPMAPTQSFMDSSNKIATTQFVSTQINNLINSAPSTMDTLGEIAAILQADTNSIGTLMSAVNLKSNIDNAALTGTTSIESLIVSGTVNGNGFTSLLSPYALLTSLSSYALNSALDSYVLSTSLATQLSSYVTNSSLLSFLNSYVTSSSLTTTLGSYALSSSLSSYALASSLSSYVTSSSITTTLGSYALSSALSSYALASSLNSYVTSTSLTTTLGSYALTSSLSSYALVSTLSSYVTSSSLTTTLGSYLLSTTASSTYQTIANVNNILNGTTPHTGFTNSGLSINNRIAEVITSLTGSSNITASYSSSGIFYIAAPTATNFQISLTNVPTTSTYITYTITLLINTTTNKFYCNSLSINGSAVTLVYNNGSANVVVTSATLVLQQICIVFLASSTVPSYAIASVVSIY